MRDNADGLLGGHDLVIDGSDNFATRLAVSDACVELGIPLVSAAAVQFQGQVGLFRGRPCYRCFVGDAFDADDCDNCAELGVLGALTATVGSFAALLAINAIVGIGDDPAGKVHLFDGEKLVWRNLHPGRPRLQGLWLSLGLAPPARSSRRATSSLVASGQSSTPVGGDQMDAVARCRPSRLLRRRWRRSSRRAWRSAWRWPARPPARSRPRSRRAGAGARSLAPSSARMSRVGSELELGRAVAFLELVGEGSTRQSATAATRIAASAGSDVMTASAICSAVSTSTRSTPAGVAARPGQRPASRAHRPRPPPRRLRNPAVPTSGWRSPGPGRSARASGRR